MNTKLADYTFLGVDVGGSHITAAPVLPHTCTIDADNKIRIKIDALGEATAILNDWTSLLNRLCHSSEKSNIRIGIAMPGPFDYENGISLIKGMHKYDSLYGLDIRKILSDTLGISAQQILFRNDAEAFLHGEVTSSKAAQSARTVGVTLGTGLGSAVSENGITKDVFRAIKPMHDGIAEDYISTRWFQKRYSELCGGQLKDVQALLSDKDHSLKERLFDEFGANLGRFLNDFVTDEGADRVIIGGNIARCWNEFKEQTLHHIHNKAIVVTQSTLWEHAALIGAACSWPEAGVLIRAGAFSTGNLL